MANAKDRLHELSDEQARKLAWYFIGYFHLEEDPRWDEAVESFFRVIAEATKCPNCGELTADPEHQCSKASH